MDKSKLKKLLTTASAFTMIAGASTQAVAAMYTDNGANVTLANGGGSANVFDVGANAAGNFANGGNFYFKTANKTLTTGGAVTIGSIDLNNKAPAAGGFTVAHAVTVGPITDASGNGNTMKIVINNGLTLTLANNAGVAADGNTAIAAGTFDGVGNIVLGSGGGGSTLTINSAATLGGTIDDDGTNDGVINIGAAGVIFNGIVGAGAGTIERINIGNGFDLRLNANTTMTANGNGVVLTGTGRLKIGNGVTLTNGAIVAGGANEGVLEFLGAGVVTDKIGNGGHISQIIASGNGAVDLQGTVIKAKTITVAHATADIQTAANSAVNGNVVYTQGGKVSLANGTVLTGNVTTTSNTAADGTNGGQLVAAQGATVTGTIGADANRLALVKASGNGVLAVSNGAHYAKEFNFANAGAILEVAAGGVGSLTGNAVANGANQGTIKYLGAGKFTGTLGSKLGNKMVAVIANGAAKVEVSGGEHGVNTFELTNAGSIFEFADGADITGAIDVTSGFDNNGQVIFLGSGVVSGTTGATNSLATIDLKGNENSVVKFGGTVKATTINVGQAAAKGGTIELSNAGDIVGELKFLDAANGTGRLLISGNAGNHTIGAVTVATRADGSGEIEITNAVSNRTIIANGMIGNKANDDKYLKKITLDSGGNSNTLQFDVTDSHIAEIAVTANGNNEGGIIKFNAANGQFRIGTVTPGIANKGHINIAQNTEFLTIDANTGITIGDANTPIALLTIGNAKILKLAHGSEVYANALTAANVNAGVITFDGDAIFSAASTNAIADINVNNNGKTVKLVKATAVNGQVIIDNGATLEVAANFTGGNFKGKGLKQGTLRFTNAAASVVTSTIGAGNSLNVIEFAGGNVDLQGDVTHAAGQEFKFTGANTTTVTLNANTNVATNVFNNTSANGVTHTVVINAAATAFNGAKLGENAANGNGFINFQLDNAKNASLNGATIATGANFTTGTPGKGELDFIGAGITVNSVGVDGKSLAKVTFTESGGIAAGTFATAVQIDAAKVATLGGRVKSDNLHLVGDLSKVIYADGAIVDSITKADIDTKGLVEFAGSGTLNQDISVSGGNKVAQVKFADDVTKTLTLNANIASVDVQMRKGIVKLAKDVTLAGTTVTAAATTFDLGSQKLNASTLAMSGTNNIAFAATVNGNAVTGGQIVVAQGGTLAYAAGTAINVLAQDSGSLRPTGGATRTFTLIANNTGTAVTGANALDITKVNVTNTNTLTEWTKAVDANGGLVLVQEDNALEVLTDVLGSSATQDQKDNLAALTEASSGTDAAKVVDMMSTLVRADGTEIVKGKVAETMDRLTTTTTVTDNIAGTGAGVSNALGARLDNLAGIQQTGTPVQTREVAAAETGISAGEESARYGVWATPFYNQTVQKARKGAAGYKGTTVGGSFGFDTRANDDLIIGAAVTVANSEMKHKNFKSGDKTKVNSLLFSIYGMQQITDAWFVNGIATFGTNDVKNNEKRVSGLTTYDTVSGKYTSMSFNGEVMFGYGIAMQQVAVTPMVGLRYSRVNDGGYTETGSTTGQNLKVNTKASNKLEAILGARVSGGTFDVNGMNVTPEVHAFVNQDLIGKTSKPTITLAGAGNLSTKSRKPIRTVFNVGLGVMANYGMMEYGAGYDADIANKRVGHTGTLKIRVNF